MDFADHIAAVDDHRTRIVAALRSGDLGATVPTCPDFTLDQLAFHIGEFSSFWSHVVCEGAGLEKTPYPEDPGASGRADWVDELIGHLVASLREAGSGTTCWTWHEPDQSTDFVATRACHELAIHRVDAQLAAGHPPDPVAPAVAADGIEEVFLLMEAHGVDGERGTPGHGETLHLHGTDVEPAEWLVRLDPARVTVTREHAKGDLAIRATVSDLEMLLYQRPTVGEVEWFGERSVLDVFHGEFTFG